MANTNYRTPMYVKCKPCGHQFIGLYLPMEMSDAAKVIKSLHCPMCAADASKIIVAQRQDGGGDA